MLVVSDTSAITSLITIKRDRLLAELFDEVVIPSAVERELRVIHPQLPSFLDVRQVKDAAMVNHLLNQLDPGEAEAIVLAKEISADLLLIDEQRGRTVALREGVPIIGLLGTLVAARKIQLIPLLGEVLDELEARTHFRLASELKEQALRAVGELK